MSQGQTKITFGARQARALCHMSHSARLDFLAEGLPLILTSARGFWDAAVKLPDDAREASVLTGFAEEEAAKALILVDLVRCPRTEIAARIGRVIKTIFYSHLARLIYAQAQSWKPIHVTQLQEYVNHERQGHYLEGGMSEYIVPNWSIYRRESTMYADIEVHEDGVPQWNDPNRWNAFDFVMRPLALNVVEALNALGVFTRPGLQAMSDVWGTVDFKDQEGHSEERKLTRQLAARLEAEGLVTDAANEDHANAFYNYWQIPMYNLDFAMIDVPLEDLVAERDAAFWHEAGY